LCRGLGASCTPGVSVCCAGGTCAGGVCRPFCYTSATCASGQICCGAACVDSASCPTCCDSNTCVDLSSDPANCGACGHACGGGTCVNGSCVCNPGYTACNGACVDLQSDPTNCGACGYDCDANTGFEGCRNGACCFPNGSACFFVGPDATCCSGQCGHFGESYASCG